MVHLEIKPSWATLTTMFLLLLSKALPDSPLFTCEVLSLPKSFPIPEITSLLCHLKIPKPCLLCCPPSCTTSSQRGSPELTSFMAFLIPCPDQWRDPPMKEEDWWHFTILKILPTYLYTETACAQWIAAFPLSCGSNYFPQLCKVHGTASSHPSWWL